MFNFSGVLSIKKDGEIIYEKKDTFTLNKEKTSYEKFTEDKIKLIQKANV
ncbi:TPA: hypothetical protein LA742_001714 [Clostridium botulinum]|uniref:Uncharacterized protein n=2 Tax=Clostridium botulinum TaxID=1491 RepID=A0ABC8CXK1_CLOBO|nr:MULTISPECIES: hypothetical protein [Clostridium]AUM96818.1 hypothetical protein RSJ11_17330 [Clostridium sporogenes]AVQ38947.1 hypothetical protein C7M56_09715 [Clostridium botulinum]AVQ54270.1 hypothetical protein C7M59_15935 [Clostridium botulinum]EKO1912871.1 hypothetical protein [Clostridium botulinum]EKO2042932.1 hypothetical protein [Clostridium botulinum]